MLKRFKKLNIGNMDQEKVFKNLNFTKMVPENLKSCDKGLRWVCSRTGPTNNFMLFLNFPGLGVNPGSFCSFHLFSHSSKSIGPYQDNIGIEI
jgi:hypothetical protein